MPTTRFSVYSGDVGRPAAFRFAPLHPPIRRLAVWDWYDLVTPVVVPSVFFVVPPSGTTRGGETLVCGAGASLVDDSLDTSFLWGVPDGGVWTAASSGSGLVGGGLGAGVLLDSRGGAGTASLTRLTLPAFDVAVDVSVIAPGPAPAGNGGAVGGGVDVVVLSATMVDETVSVRLRWDGRRLLAQGVGGGGATATAAVPDGPLTLRIVSGGGYAFGYVAVRDPFSFAADGSYTDLVPVFGGPLATVGGGGGVVTVGVSGGAGLRVAARVLRATFRSQVLIGGQPLVQKRDVSVRRLVGAAPPAAGGVDDVGPVDVVFLGPWGSHTLVNGYQYVLPPVRTLGQVPSNLGTGLSTAVTATDPVLIDGT